MNSCFGGGALVDARSPVPDDLTDYYAHPGLGLMGCNRLYCRRCDSWVRNEIGVGFALPNMQVDLAELYERERLLGREIMKTYPSRRLYLCRCSRWLEAFSRPVYIPDPDPDTDPEMPWLCGGHPVVELPAEIDGVPVASAADVEALAARAFAGFAGPAARPKEAAAWHARLHARLRGGPEAGRVVARAVAALADPDPAVRGRALRFFFIFPLPAGVSPILDALEGDRALYAGVPAEPWEWRDNRTLEESAWWVAAQFLDKSERVLELARREVVTPGKGRALYMAMAVKDGAWLLEHVAEIVRANPAQVGELLDAAWTSHDEPRAVVGAVAALDEVPAATIDAFASRLRLGNDDRAALDALVAARRP